MNLFLLSLGSLISVINPFGTIPVFMRLTEDKTKQQIISIAFRTSLNMLIILLISFFAGKYILSFFGISLSSLKIAGGLIIASSGFALLTGSFNRHKGMKKKVKDDALSRSDITLTPLAIPMLAGPGTISLLITYNQEYSAIPDKLTIIGSVVLVSLITFLLLNISRIITKKLGDSGMNSLARIIGFIVIAIGIEFILSSLISIASHLIK
jgi:multiple antibiotic resistance protein